MTYRKILVMFGTRPEAIKMAPVIHALQENSPYVTTQVCVTAQHREMLDQVLDIFHILPDFDLDLMKKRQDLEDITASILQQFKDILRQVKPDIVLVHGDTSTTFATSLTCFYENIPVGHVEAGLRTYNFQEPWPEEMNRRVTGILASLHFAPTRRAFDNLVREGVSETRISITGNTVIDALFYVLNRLQSNPDLAFRLSEKFSFLHSGKRLLLVTAHRRESFGQKLEEICLALKDIAEQNDVELVYPVHLNPNVKNPVQRILSNVPNIYLLDPLDYLDFVYLMNRSYLIITDSGGIQEEAPALGKPVLVLRDTTERPEALEAGTVKLIGTQRQRIMQETNMLLHSEDEYRSMSHRQNPFGDGYAARRIMERLRTD
mgnify:CR=1 FL=1